MCGKNSLSGEVHPSPIWWASALRFRYPLYTFHGGARSDAHAEVLKTTDHAKKGAQAESAVQ
jgi:hypothetical protein